jgi:hypothetical protein
MTTAAIQRKYWSVVISSLDTLLAAPGTSDTALKEQRDIFKLRELFVAERQGTPPSHAAWQILLRDQVSNPPVLHACGVPHMIDSSWKHNFKTALTSMSRPSLPHRP